MGNIYALEDSPPELQEKLRALIAYLKELSGVAVAFSGGVDSTFLLHVSHEVLGDKVLSVTAVPLSFPQREINEAKAFCQKEGIRHIICPFDELKIEGFRQNPKNRCYLCKRELFGKIISLAKDNGIDFVAEGSNMDDMGDYRPGMQAIAELGIKSPLREAKLTKTEIRKLSKGMGLYTWDKPSFACLASRFPYGEEISAEKLAMVEKAEDFLLQKGFRQVRVRIHGNLARIEILPGDFAGLIKIGEEVTKKFKEHGFHYVAMDLVGYRTGSMNEGVIKA